MTLAFHRGNSFWSLAFLLVSVFCLSFSEALLSYRSLSFPTISTFSSIQSKSKLATRLFASSSQSIPKRKRGTNGKASPTASKAAAAPASKAKTISDPNKKTRKSGPGRSLSKEELTDHVAGRYMEDVKRLSLADWDNEKEESSSNAMATIREQDEFLRELNRRPTLVLNADFQPLSYLPLSLWSWQDAVKAVFSGKVQVVDVYPDVAVRAANFEVPLPSVIALSEYVAHKNQRPAFTRRNVFLRDEYKCQYCNDRFHTADLSLDHVHPRCMGGQLTWENAVTSCLKCNGRKGSMPIAQLRSIGMKLVREPKCPTPMELAAKAARMIPRRVHPTWKPFLGIAETPKSLHSPTAGGSGGIGGGDEDFIDDRYFEVSSL